MNAKQNLELEAHFDTIDEAGNKVKSPTNTIPWLVQEALENVDRLEDLLMSKDRAPKREIKPVLKDLEAQLKELRKRFT